MQRTASPRMTRVFTCLLAVLLFIAMSESYAYGATACNYTAFDRTPAYPITFIEKGLCNGQWWYMNSYPPNLTSCVIGNSTPALLANDTTSWTLYMHGGVYGYEWVDADGHYVGGNGTFDISGPETVPLDFYLPPDQQFLAHTMYCGVEPHVGSSGTANAITTATSITTTIVTNTISYSTSSTSTITTIIPISAATVVTESAITFTEHGLKSGLGLCWTPFSCLPYWTVNIGLFPQVRGQELNSLSMTFNGLQDGNTFYTVDAPPGYQLLSSTSIGNIITSPTGSYSGSGIVDINNANVEVNVAFEPVGSGISDVQFTETGLQSGWGLCWTPWSCAPTWAVTLDGQVLSSTSDSITFSSLPNGNYQYYLFTPSGFKQSATNPGPLITLYNDSAILSDNPTVSEVTEGYIEVNNDNAEVSVAFQQIGYGVSGCKTAATMDLSSDVSGLQKPDPFGIAGSCLAGFFGFHSDIADVVGTCIVGLVTLAGDIAICGGAVLSLVLSAVGNVLTSAGNSAISLGNSIITSAAADGNAAGNFISTACTNISGSSYSTLCNALGTVSGDITNAVVSIGGGLLEAAGYVASGIGDVVSGIGGFLSSVF